MLYLYIKFKSVASKKRNFSMKIKSIETYTNKYIGLVKVNDAAGNYGWGQVAPYNSDISVQILHRQIAKHAIGVDTDKIKELSDIIPEKEHKYPGSYLMRALSGLDTALWDLKGRKENKSVCELLGGIIKPLRVYGSSMRRDIRPEDEVVRLLKLRDQYGFDAFKFRIGEVCGRDADRWPGRTEEIVKKVSKSFKGEVDLLVDANSCYTPAKAIQIGKYLEDHGISHFEEPCPYWELEWTKEVKDALAIDVTGGEQDCDINIWKRMIDIKAVDIVQPDICYLGGLTRTLKIVELANQAGIPCTPHSANLSMVTVFTLHMMGAISGGGKYVEFTIETSETTPWGFGIYEPELKVIDGKVKIPDGPGWGVEINKKWLETADYQISEI